MSITLKQSVDRVMRKLDNNNGTVWPMSQIENFIVEGYESICREVPCLFDMVMFDNAPLACNHTRKFEEQFITGRPILGTFGFTKESERESVEAGAQGPSNHTRPADAQYVTPPSVRVLGKLPENYVVVDRVTHDWLRLDGEHSRALRLSRTSYETMQGGAFSYSMEQDGIFAIRTVSVASTVLPAVEFQYATVDGQRVYHGVIRRVTDYGMDTEDVSGSWGIIRSMPRHFVSGQYGGLRRIAPDENSTRVELFRTGRSLQSEPFEVPDRVVRYIEWWAMSQAYAVPNAGEDKALADHYKARYTIGVERLKKRMNATMDARTIAMGAKRHGSRDSYLSMFPPDYGYGRPFRS